MAEGLSAREEKMLAAILAAPSIPAAAERVGVSERCLYHTMAKPYFRAELLAARRQALEAATTMLSQRAAAAVSALLKNLTCGVPAVEVRAAVAILETATKAVEICDLAERIEALEARARCTNGKLKTWPT